MEFIDVVDKDDHVIGRASKVDIYKKRLLHRIVHIFVFDKKGRMLLQLRSAKCSFCPLHWSTSVGGHVRAGETCENAALREYKEELGAKSYLELLSKDFYKGSNSGPGSPDKFLITFKTVCEGPFKPDKNAVNKIGFFNLGEINDMIRRREKFHPELLFLLDKHYGIKPDPQAKNPSDLEV